MVALVDKKCCSCKKSKSYVEFHKSKNTKDGLKHKCKLCRSLEPRNYKKEYIKNKTSILKYQKNYRDNMEDKYNFGRKKTLRKYGLTEKSYNDMLNSQEGKCAIVQKPLRIS